MLKEIKNGQFLVFVCFPDSDDWHQISKYDPDQEQYAQNDAERYLSDYMPEGSQVAVAQIFTYGIKECNCAKTKTDGESEHWPHCRYA